MGDAYTDGLYTWEAQEAWWAEFMDRGLTVVERPALYEEVTMDEDDGEEDGEGGDTP